MVTPAVAPSSRLDNIRRFYGEEQESTSETEGTTSTQPHIKAEKVTAPRPNPREPSAMVDLTQSNSPHGLDQVSPNCNQLAYFLV